MKKISKSRKAAGRGAAKLTKVAGRSVRPGPRLAPRPAVAAASAPAPSKERVSPQPTPQEADGKKQAESFDKAVALFRRRDFRQARELFAQAARGPLRELSHAAMMHIRMCERRLESGQPAPKSPEDYYNLGIGLMNRGDHKQAEEQLRKAVKANDQAAHYHYALALCLGLRGLIEEAAAHLRRSIEIEPGNRIAARNDAEFKSISQHPALREVLNLERSKSG